MQNDESLEKLSSSKDLSEIADSIMRESDPEKIKDLTELFNINAKKKKIVRASKVNELLDLVSAEMSTRLETMPDTFSNDVLLNYWKVLEDSSMKLTSDENEVKDNKLISLTQNNQVNILTESDLNTRSRKNVTEAVRKILQNISNSQVDEIEGDENG